ncbi:MAG: Cna B-type domain-containing protein [Lachnospiraceae bacterium]|nr:Cna B-type domain-containing protein [Lachnospiraceae bacterium]
MLSNGYLFMGTVINYEIGDALQVNADKQLLDQYGVYAGIEEGQFNFEITDENGEEVSTGTTQSDGSIFFARRLSFNEAGTFTFFIKETAPAEPGFIIDSAVYTLVVTVRASEEEVEVAGVPLDFVYYNITHVTLTKSGSADPLVDQDVTSSEDTVTSITIPSPAFVNQEAEKTSISVQKTWQDESGAGIDWPADIDAITVYLYQNGEIYKEAVTLTESSPGYTWTDLPICGTDASGEIVTYIYEVTEDAVEGYETEITEGDDSVTIVNTHIPETINIEGSKTWDDHNDQDGKRPSSVTISLYADGVPALDENGEAISAIVTGEDWTYSFTNLPKNDNGREIKYTVIETAVDDYTAVYDGYDITNSYIPGKTALNVRKFWDDADDQDEIRPEKITVVLMKNGEETDQTLTLDKSNDWFGSFTDLDEYTDGILNEYSVAEIAVEGYDCDIVAVEDTTTVHITNSHTPDREDKEDQDKEEKKPGSKTPPTTDKPSSASPTSAAGGKTGDQNHPGLWIALLAAAGVIVVVRVSIQTRRTRQRRR